MAYRGRPFRSGGYRGGQHIARPENALKRAEELILVGQTQAALDNLHETLTTGRRQRTWTATFESIMFRHIDLCCETRKGRMAKEALQQYRNMCQSVNVGSLEEVIKYFMNKASEKAEDARSKADEATNLDVEDLEVDATPEDIMLSYVSGEKSKDRTDRTLVTPWFRFLWETYRNLLDILRHNSRLEALYALTINRAFQFCLQYKRTSEFRRLCELLRSHLTNIQRRALYGKEQKDRPDLTVPETLQLHVDTRFEQLKVACELELWQEAFRSVEDIINLVAINVKIVKPQMMAAYYARLTQVFAFSDDSTLYCGYAWFKLFNLAKNFNKNLAPQDVQMLASSVLLTALSIRPYNRAPIRPSSERSDQVRERNRRLANILCFGLEGNKLENQENYSREDLLNELSRPLFLKLVPPEIQKLYFLLEIDFKPLELCKTVEKLLGTLEGLQKPLSPACPIDKVDLTTYAERLKHVAVLRMLKHMSSVYANMKVSSVNDHVPFMSFSELEAIIVDACKHGYLQVRIDHKDGMLYFSGDDLDSDKFQSHMSLMAKRLASAVKMIRPSETEERKARVDQAIAKARDKVDEEHAYALARKDLIERRKEEQEQVLLEKERAEERKRREQMEQAQAAEELRRRQDAARREEERIRREMEEREQEKAKAMSKRNFKEGQKVDTEEIMREVISEKLKEQQDLDRRLQKLAKQLDCLERACREEEKSFILESYEQKKVEDEEFYETEKAETLENRKAAWENDIKEKHRLSKMMDDKEAFERQVRNRRREEFAALQRAHEERIAEKKRQRKMERDRARRIKYVEKCKEELEDSIREEEEKQKREEEERRKDELRRKREEKEREFQRELEMQRKKDQEIEERMRRDKASMLGQGGQGQGPRAEEDRWGKRDATPPRERDNDRWGRRERTPPRNAPPGPPGSGAGGYVPPGRRRGIETAAAPRDSPRVDGDRWGRNTPPRDRRTPPRERRTPPRGRPDGDHWGRRDTRSPPPRSPQRARPTGDRWERNARPSPPRSSPPRARNDGERWGSRSPRRSPPRQARPDGDRWERAPGRSPPRSPRGRPGGGFGGGQGPPRSGGFSDRRGGYEERRGFGGPPPSGDRYMPPSRDRYAPPSGDRYMPPSRNAGPPGGPPPGRDGPPPPREESGGGGSGRYVPPSRRQQQPPPSQGGGGARW